MSRPRSSDTSPPLVDTVSLPPSTIRRNASWACLFAFAQSSWTCGLWSASAAARSASSRTPLAAGPASPWMLSGSAFASCPCTSTLSNSAWTRKSSSAVCTRSSARTFVLVWVHVSVSSSWRDAQTPNTAKNATTPARTVIAIEVRLSRIGAGILERRPHRLMSRRAGRGRRSFLQQPLLEVLRLARGHCARGPRLVELDAPRLGEVQKPLALRGVGGPLQERPGEHREGHDHPLAHHDRARDSLVGQRRDAVGGVSGLIGRVEHAP